MKAYFLFFLFIVSTFSCAKNVTNTQASLDENIVYKPANSQKKKFMSCNFFADDTFRGYIYRSSSKDDCFHIDIIESPQELLKNEDLFLQVYPFKIFRDELNYGYAQTIYTVPKQDSNKPLMQSQMIDTHIVLAELELEPDYFFLDHNLEVCDIDEQWDGLQLVVYERRQGQSEPVPIRITKFLNPPFLIHPEFFREKAGVKLAVYHPFLDFIPELKSEPDKYYEIAEELCSHF